MFGPAAQSRKSKGTPSFRPIRSKLSESIGQEFYCRIPEREREREMAGTQALKRIPRIKFPQRHPKSSGTSLVFFTFNLFLSWSCFIVVIITIFLFLFNLVLLMFHKSCIYYLFLLKFLMKLKILDFDVKPEAFIYVFFSIFYLVKVEPIAII